MGLVGTSLLGERLTGVVGSGTWNDERLLVDELDSHVEARLFFKGLRLGVVVAGGGHKQRMTVVEHLPLIATKAIVGRSRLGSRGLGVVLDLRVNVLSSDAHLSSLRGAEAIVGGSFHCIDSELVCAGSWHQLVIPLLKLVVVQG